MAKTKEYNLLKFVDKIQEKELIEMKYTAILESIRKHQERFKESEPESIAEEIEKIKLEDLEHQEKAINEKVLAIQSNCGHELIIYLGVRNNRQYAVCLECEKVFVYEINENVDKENMIDISDLIPEKYIWLTINNKNIMASKAIEKISLLGEYYSEMDLEELKQNIIEVLIYYSDELEYSEIKPRKRKRIFE